MILIVLLTLASNCKGFKMFQASQINMPFVKFTKTQHVNYSGAVANSFGRITWGLILDRIGTRATYTIAFIIQVRESFISNHDNLTCYYDE